MKWNAAMKQMTRSICSPIPATRSSAMISGDAASNGGCDHQEKSRITQYISLESGKSHGDSAMRELYPQAEYR